jgi:hypothetical protein
MPLGWAAAVNASSSKHNVTIHANANTNGSLQYYALFFANSNPVSAAETLIHAYNRGWLSPG